VLACTPIACANNIYRGTGDRTR